MTETATRKPLLTRRRVIIGAVMLVLALVITLLWNRSRETKARAPIGVSIQGFEQIMAEKAAGSNALLTVAVLVLTNWSDKYFDFPTGDHGTTVVGIISARRPKGGTTSIAWFPFANYSETLEPHSAKTMKVRLPEDGSIGKIEVFCYHPTRDLDTKFQRLVYRIESVFNPKANDAWAVSDDEIQCPRVRSDGTVEPPRLLPKDHKSR